MPSFLNDCSSILKKDARGATTQLTLQEMKPGGMALYAEVKVIHKCINVY